MRQISKYALINIISIIDDAAWNLWGTKERSTLALLGILIGAAAVVSMVSIGSMAERETVRQFEQMGINSFFFQTNVVPLGVGPPVATKKIKLDIDVLLRLRRDVPEISSIGGFRAGFVPVGGSVREPQIGLAAITPEFQDIARLHVINGRHILPIDSNNLIVVLGSKAAERLEQAGHSDKVGSTLRLGSYLFTIVGVFNDPPPGNFFPFDLGGSVYIPLHTGDRVLGERPLDGAIGLFYPNLNLSEAAASASAAITRDDGGVPIQVQSARDLISIFHRQRDGQTKMFTAVAAIALLVGGIGIMNVMLMSVLERRREIGIRAAVGATPADIQVGFIIEAGLLAVTGGGLGIIVGALISATVAAHSGWAFYIPFNAVALSSALSAGVGLLFGSYPAVKASRLSPIEALRAD